MCLLFCDVDSEGRIIDSIMGERVIPLKQYDHFFFLSENVETVAANISNYKVVNGQLTLEG